MELMDVLDYCARNKCQKLTVMMRGAEWEVRMELKPYYDGEPSVLHFIVPVAKEASVQPNA